MSSVWGQMQRDSWCSHHVQVMLSLTSLNKIQQHVQRDIRLQEKHGTTAGRMYNPPEGASLFILICCDSVS